MFKFTRTFLGVLSIYFLTLSMPAQATAKSVQPEANFDVVLNVLIGGDSSIPGSALPADLSPITRHLKSNYSFTTVKLADTYIGRITNGGNFEFKSMSKLFGGTSATERPVFVEWSIAGLKSEDDLGLQAFRFGANLPVVTGITKDRDGKDVPVMNYERIGLTSTKLTLPQSKPTVIGSLTLPNAGSSLFLVLTLKPV